MSTQEHITAYVGAFVDELARVGTNHVVISPGSRSTSIAMLMAEHPGINVWMDIDERSAGYFALGIAKAKKEPVALLCTSGTAAANYLPAVVEAKQARVPLLILTADRPHELRDVGAPQAINQLNLFGTYAKWFMEMAIPDSSEEMIRYARTVAGRVSALALSTPSGPVHLNFPLREPLIPNLDSPTLWGGGREDNQSYVQVKQGLKQLNHAVVEKLAYELNSMEEGLIICGPESTDGFPEAVVQLAETLQFPILADPLSQLRTGSHHKHLIIDSYDAFLKADSIKKQCTPKVIIRFGAMPVSKSLMLYLKTHPNCRLIIIDDGEEWLEPTLLASDMIYVDPVLFCNQLSRAIKYDRMERTNPWLDKWINTNQVTKEIVLKEGCTSELSEGRVFMELQEMLPHDSILFVGNSMPIRDLDTFFTCHEGYIRTMANRGANGIDGVVSSALGASTIGLPLVLVIGDISFYHDLNGLLVSKLHQLNITIILLNNDGGGIFSFLPQHEHPTHYEKLFGTPTGLNYRHAIEMYSGSYFHAHDWGEFKQYLKQGIETDGLFVIEVQTDRKQNLETHRTLWKKVADAFNNEKGGPTE